MLVLDLVGRDDEQADQQRGLEARDQPSGADREPCGEQQLSGDCGEHGQLSGPERLGGGRRWIWTTDLGGGTLLRTGFAGHHTRA